ncbi:MAG TPA: zinc-ribbon domain-containing protein [Polyangiaceae bacterium]
MKITCQACAAKYTIADDKVLGKVVKIRCKKCGATIVVNGNESSASAPADAGRAFDYAAQGGQGDTWTVNVADGDQRTMTDGEIAEAYRAGVVSDETYCWKDGMTDWLPLREIDQLYASCSATRAVAPSDDAGAGPTRIQQGGPGLFNDGRAGAPTGAASAYAAPRPAAGMAAPMPQPGNGAMAAAASPAARRQGGRAPGADLFGTAAQAGGEEDVMTSAPVGMPEVHDDGKLTGARNENSVLFSLNALTSKGPSGPPGRPLPASSEASGLIDIRQLSAQIGIEEKKKSRIDDIMNLAGGGAFSPSLSAPILAAPPIEEYAAPAPSMSPGGTGAMPAAGKNKAVIFGAIGAGVVVIVGAVGLAVMFVGGKSDKDKAAASASATDTTSPPSSALAMNAIPAGSATGTTPTDTASAAATASAPADTAPAATSTTVATAATAKPSATHEHEHEHEHEPPPPAATHEAAPPPAAAAGGADTPFNMGEAKAQLGAIAGSVQGCKKGDASGTGHVVVTFAPNGRATSAVVTGPPFAGTPTGACVASRFHGAHVPAFSGSPFSVSKHFTIN